MAPVALRRPKVCIYEKTNNAVVLHAYSCEIILKTSFKPLVLLLAGAEKRVTDDEKATYLLSDGGHSPWPF